MFTFVGQQDKARRRATLVVSLSLALHLAALSALLGTQLWSVPPVQEPPVNTVFLMLRQLPVPPGGGQPPVRKDPLARQPPATRPPIHQPEPRNIPPLLPPEDPARPAVSDVFPDPNTSPLQPAGPGTPADGPGFPGGPSGPGFDSGPVGPAGPVDEGPLHVGGGVVRPQLIPETKVQPRYTERARTARLQGLVLLEAIIDERGNVVDVRLVRGLPMGLSDEAIAAVSQWKFRPATLAGKPVKVYFNLRVDFQVH
jgi:protein TonB